MAVGNQGLTFISYSRKNKEFALQLAKELKAAGFRIWLDQLDIPTGARWDDELETALENCEVFMVILTPASTESENVKDEIGYAIDSHKYILPILLENAKVPLRLRRFQYVDFTGKSHAEGVEAAKQLLIRLLEQKPAPTPEPPPLAVPVQENETERLAKQKAGAEAAASAKAEAERQAKKTANQLAAQKTAAEQTRKEKLIPAWVKAVPISITAFQKRPFPKGLAIGGIVVMIAVVALILMGIGSHAFSSQPPTVTKEAPIVSSSATKVKPTNTAVPTKTSTPRPTSTPNLSATRRATNATATAKSAEALAAQASQWNLKFTDSFDNNKNNWYTAKLDDEYGKGEMKIKDGKYFWSYTAKKGVVYRAWHYTTSLTDFYLTVEAKETGTARSPSYGIVFRNSTSNDFYYFGIYPKQKQYYFYMYYKGEWENLIDPTSSTAIRSDEPNELTLVARGSYFVFFINNKFVAEKTDGTLKNGPMGLVIELDANEQITVEFDNIEVRTAPK